MNHWSLSLKDLVMQITPHPAKKDTSGLQVYVCRIINTLYFIAATSNYPFCFYIVVLRGVDVLCSSFRERESVRHSAAFEQELLLCRGLSSPNERAQYCVDLCAGIDIRWPTFLGIAKTCLDQLKWQILEMPFGTRIYSKSRSENTQMWHIRMTRTKCSGGRVSRF